MGILGLFLHGVFVENLVLSYGLGVDQVLHREQRGKESLFLGLEASGVLGALGVVLWLFYNGVLVNLQLEYLGTFFTILLIAGTGLLWNLLSQRRPGIFPSNRGSMGPLYLSPVAFGFLTLVVSRGWSLPETLIFAVSGGFGLALVSLMVFAVRFRMRLEDLPKALQGEPILFFTVGVISLGFSLFDRIVSVPF